MAKENRSRMAVWCWSVSTAPTFCRDLGHAIGLQRPESLAHRVAAGIEHDGKL